MPYQSKAQKLIAQLKPVDLFINGKFTAPRGGEYFPLNSPLTEKPLTQAAAATSEDVDLAVKAARETFETGLWSQQAPQKRKEILLKLAQLIEDHQEELALLETLEVGKPIHDSLNMDLPGAIRCIRWYAEATDKIYGEVAPTPSGHFATITRAPLGVVAIVVPWNFPLLMAAWKVAPALAAGNSVILKPSENASLCARRLVEFAHQAGVPDGAFNLLTGRGPTVGKALGLHSDIDGVFFTGSTQVGKEFVKYSAQSNLKKFSVECGGKSAHLILEDCQRVKEAAYKAADAIFFNQGEMCSAGSRLLVHRSKIEEVKKYVVERAAFYQPKDPLDSSSRLGTIINQTQYDKIVAYIEKAQKEGAHLLTSPKTDELKGLYIAPTILADVTPQMTIAQEEVFGPVLAILTFDTCEEAIKIANGTIYGLASAVWSDNVTSLFTAAQRLRSGTVYMNCYDADDITVPFGGFKQSGIGRDKSLHAFDKYTELKSSWLKID